MVRQFVSALVVSLLSVSAAWAEEPKDGRARPPVTPGDVVIYGPSAVKSVRVVDAGYRVYNGVVTEHRYRSGLITAQQRTRTQAKNAAGMAGGWTGASAGTWYGGQAGAAIGSFFPGPGTLIGGLAGAMLGGCFGYRGGEAAAEAAVDVIVK